MILSAFGSSQLEIPAKEIFQVAIIACQIYKYCALCVVARLSGDAGACQKRNRMKKTVPCLQINANFFNCAHTMLLVNGFSSTEYISEGVGADCLFLQYSAADFIKLV